MNPAADLCRRLRNPSWPESIPLSALEAMEEAARVIESGLKPAPAKAPPLWYVATYGETGVHGGPVDCLCDVSFYDSPLAYGRACKAAARLHDSGDIDSYTMGPAMAPNAEAKARAAAIAKAQKRAARAEAKAAAAKAKEEAAAKAKARAADLKGGRA